MQLPGVGGGIGIATINVLEHVRAVPKEPAKLRHHALLVTFVAVVRWDLFLVTASCLSLGKLSQETEKRKDAGPA